MLKGPAYLESASKRSFDLSVAGLLKPATVAARLGAQASFGYAIYEDIRVGRNGQPDSVRKIQTLDQHGAPISSFANAYRAYGADELTQIDDVFEGTISIIGRRRLLPNEYDKLRDIASSSHTGKNLLKRWDESVLPFRCGLLSQFAIEAHLDGDSGVIHRLERDIEQYENASLASDLTITLRCGLAAATGQFKHGSLPINDDPRYLRI